MTLALPLLAVALGLALLAWERIRLERHRKAIPLRIAVTGTRGKSTVARLLASVLRESGRKVLAKTTGTEARLVLPDGSEEEIRRRGRPSILEQKRFLARGARMGVEAVVVEVMSIHPENHRVEGRRILQPHLVLATNFRVDHTDAQGWSREEVASVLALAVPPGARVLAAEEECLPAFREAVARAGAMLVPVPMEEEWGTEPRPALPGVPSALAAPPTRAAPDPGAAGHFPRNLALVRAAARSLGVGEEAIGEGIRRVRQDAGALGIWRYDPGGGRAPILAVNAFAANDPESTALVLDRVLAVLERGGEQPTGLLTLRADRGERSLQWARALEEGFLERFERVYVHGRHARALRRRVPSEKVKLLGPTRPEEIMEVVASGMGAEGGILFGFGNIGGVGGALAAHWRGVGEAVTHSGA